MIYVYGGLGLSIIIITFIILDYFGAKIQMSDKGILEKQTKNIYRIILQTILNPSSTMPKYSDSRILSKYKKLYLYIDKLIEMSTIKYKIDGSKRDTSEYINPKLLFFVMILILIVSSLLFHSILIGMFLSSLPFIVLFIIAYMSIKSLRPKLPKSLKSWGISTSKSLDYIQGLKLIIDSFPRQLKIYFSEFLELQERGEIALAFTQIIRLFDQMPDMQNTMLLMMSVQNKDGDDSVAKILVEYANHMEKMITLEEIENSKNKSSSVSMAVSILFVASLIFYNPGLQLIINSGVKGVNIGSIFVSISIVQNFIEGFVVITVFFMLSFIYKMIVNPDKV